MINGTINNRVLSSSQENKGGCASGRSDLVVTQLRRKPHREFESLTALYTRSTTVGLVKFEICRNSSMVERLTYSVRLRDLFMTLLLLFLRLLSGRHWFESSLRHLYSLVAQRQSKMLLTSRSGFRNSPKEQYRQEGCGSAQNQP